jgi:hypothetical protein
VHNFLFQISSCLLFLLCVNPFSPCLAGNDDDAADDFGMEGDSGGTIYPLYGFVPIFIPDVDQERGRGIVQLPPAHLPPMPPPVIPMMPPLEQGQLPVFPGQDLQLNPDIDVVNDDFSFNGFSENPSNSDYSLNSFSPDPLPVPLIIPEGDQDQGRGAVQEPSDLPPARTFPHRLKDPRIDEKYGRQVITLDGGSPDNPYQICDRGMFYLGALLGVGFVEPHSWVQFNVLSKWKLTSGNSSHRRAENYDQGVSRKWAKYPKKVEHFDEWKVGDWIRRNGNFSLALYAGVSYFAPDMRIGLMSEVVESIHFKKLGPQQIRVSITKEAGGGVVARAQLLPFQKGEAKDVGNLERTRVYIFNIAKDDERKALDDLVQRNVIFAGKEAYHAAKHNNATLLTSRYIKRHKTTFTPVQGGVPILARGRISWHVDRYRTAITTHRGDTKYNFTAKAYYKQSTYRHKNFKMNRGSHKGKSWRNFMDKHRHYNRAYQGGVVKAPRTNVDELLNQGARKDGVWQFTNANPLKKDNQIIDFNLIKEAAPIPLIVRPNQRYLHMQRSFTNDRVQAKEVNGYIKTILKKIGVNDYMVDSGYKKSAMVGYIEITWNLRVGPNAIGQIASEAALNKNLFKDTANELIDDYFSKTDDEFKNDPHSICRSHIKNTNLCQRMVRHETQSSLLVIAKKLRSLEKHKIAKSATKTSSRLAAIAKELSTNQFVLQAFIKKLRPNSDGYGRLQIFGERVLGREFNTDPGQNMRELNSFTKPSSSGSEAQGQDENLLSQDDSIIDSDNSEDPDVVDEFFEVDWDRINNRDAANEL